MWIIILALASIGMIGMLVGCIGGITNFENDEKVEKETNKCILIGFLILVICFVSIFEYNKHTTKHILYVVNISALEDESQINGARYYISTNEYYKCIENNNNYKKQLKIPSNNTKIIEDGECKLYCYTYKTNIKIIESLLGEYNLKGLEYELHIPENSVTTKFNIDLKN